MAKNNSGKKVTIDGLAKMINRGFEKTASAEQLGGLEKRFDGLEKDVKAIRQQVAGAIFRSEFDRLESRVADLENMLAFTTKKH